MANTPNPSQLRPSPELFAGQNWKGSNSSPQNSPLAQRAQQYMDRVNERELCLYASRFNEGIPCKMLPDFTNGLHHLVRIIEFEDKARWIARIQMAESTKDEAKQMRAEIDTINLLADQTQVPVPKVFGYELTDSNPTGVAFILMEFFPGNAATDACGGYEVHKGEIPLKHRQSFYTSIAFIQSQITSVRLPRIGTVYKDEDGNYSVGPLPGIGGPFETATGFFEAWSKSARFPHSKEKVRSLMGSGPIEEVIAAIEKFPSGIRSMASQLSSSNRGPFPIAHRDFYHSNIIVDDEFHVLGVIDWEGACALPWELVEFPLFLEILPASMDSPSNYDKKGQPLDEYTKSRLQGRNEYAKMVKSAEDKCKMDSMLSSILFNDKAQDLAYAIRVYHDPGKLGFYSHVLEEYKGNDGISTR